VAAAHAGGLGVSGPERWLLSPHVGVEAADESSVVVFHGATGARLRLSKPLYEVLRAFRNPAAPAEALGRRDFAAARRCLETLRAKGFLVLADAGGRTAGVGGEVPARPVAPSPYTMFRCSPRGPGAWPAHAAVIGVPSDLGADAAGARDAPAAVRRRSAEFVYECDFDTCRPRGWFDVDRGERILAGVTIADHGDVRFHYGESLETVLARVAEATREALEAGSFPVLIGGDRSVALGSIRAVAERGPVAVVWLSAASAERAPAAWAAARQASALPNIVWLVHAGVRGAGSGTAVSQDGTRAVTVAELRVRGAAALLEALPEGLPCYVSVDIGVLDPAHAPGVGAPAPGGLEPAELTSLLRELGAAREVRCLDICDVLPSKDVGTLTSVVAAHVLLAGLGAFVSPGRAGRDGGDPRRGC